MTETVDPPQPQPQPLRTQLGQHLSDSLSFADQLSQDDEDMSRSALSTFKAKEEEIEKKKLEVGERVMSQLGRIEEENKRLTLIRKLKNMNFQKLETLSDPMRKEIQVVRTKVDAVNKELKPLGNICQKKEREYKEALEAFNEKNKENVQLINKLMELVSESEKVRMKKLVELSKSMDTLY